MDESRKVNPPCATSVVHPDQKVTVETDIGSGDKDMIWSMTLDPPQDHTRSDVGTIFPCVPRYMTHVWKDRLGTSFLLAYRTDVLKKSEVLGLMASRLAGLHARWECVSRARHVLMSLSSVVIL